MHISLGRIVSHGYVSHGGHMSRSGIKLAFPEQGHEGDDGYLDKIKIRKTDGGSGNGHYIYT